MGGPVLVDTDPGIDDALALHSLVSWVRSATRLGPGRACPDSRRVRWKFRRHAGCAGNPTV